MIRRNPTKWDAWYTAADGREMAFCLSATNAASAFLEAEKLRALYVPDAVSVTVRQREERVA